MVLQGSPKLAYERIQSESLDTLLDILRSLIRSRHERPSMAWNRWASWNQAGDQSLVRQGRCSDGDGAAPRQITPAALDSLIAAAPVASFLRINS
jgi:hypothetical protein